MPKDRATLALALSQLIIWAGLYYLFPALLVPWEQALGWRKTDLTLAITLAVLCSAVAAPITGRLIDHGHGARVMTLSTLVGGLSLFSLATIQSLWQFYFCWCIIGLCFSGCLYEPAFALITRAKGKHARQSIIAITLIAGFASSISFPIANAMNTIYGWRTTVQLFSIAVLLLGTPLMWHGARHTIPTNPQPKLKQQQSINRFLKSPIFWSLAIGFSLLGLLHGTTIHHLLPILYDQGIRPNIAITAAALIGPMQVAGRLAMMTAGNRFSNHYIAISCFIIMALSILFLLGTRATPTLLIGFVLLFGSGYGMVSIIRPLIARDVLGEHNFGAKSGAMATLYLLGSATAPYLGSLIWNIGGYRLVLTLLIVFAACGLSLYLLSYRLSETTTRP